MKMLLALGLFVGSVAHASGLGFLEKSEVLNQTIYTWPGVWEHGKLQYIIYSSSNLDAVCRLLGGTKSLGVEVGKMGNDFDYPTNLRLLNINAEGKIAKIILGSSKAEYVSRLACE